MNQEERIIGLRERFTTVLNNMEHMRKEYCSDEQSIIIIEEELEAIKDKAEREVHSATDEETGKSLYGNDSQRGNALRKLLRENVAYQELYERKKKLTIRMTDWKETLSQLKYEFRALEALVALEGINK